MCGIAGIVSKSDVNQGLYDALTVLQHRGQDAAGIMTCDDGRLFLRKGNGLVRDVFQQKHMQRLSGNMGIGHVRYPTAGSCSSAESQPFYVNSPYGITLAHNGNLTNANELAQELFRTDLRHLNTTSDSEVILNVFAHELQALGKLEPTEEDIFKACEGVHRRCKGAYALVAMITGYGIVALRDPNGIRPLVFGKRTEDDGSVEYMIASESVALDSLGFSLERDVLPGEAVFVDIHGSLHTRVTAPNTKHTPCIFEYVYLARPDSMIDGISVYKARLRMGDHLADKIKKQWSHHPIDVVIPIPDSSRTSALQVAHHLGVKYREGFIKNRYIGRTFIMPGQSQRKKSVRQKLNPIELEFKGKNVLLVDDSIVRGTTCQEIIQMARDAGANKVFFASAAPEIRHPNVYGIDMPAAPELIAHGRTVSEICESIGADDLIYQDLPDLVTSVHEGNMNVDGLECSVFDGKYITGDVSDQYLASLEKQRSDHAKSQDLATYSASGAVIDLHNDS
ncbi:amidophosphoribosyltransferase [Poriferisphaera sp. WC338]|uniref:amidophosphoribosyltransferase n=1 Tax=Poriferisphaera sp. WC338 TaxID=3425129 RepID=UPI003D818A7A